MQWYDYVLVSSSEILESRLHKETLYLMLDQDTYRSHKTDANLLSLYEQEVKVRMAYVEILKERPLLCEEEAAQLQAIENEISRYSYLCIECVDRLKHFGKV